MEAMVSRLLEQEEAVRVVLSSDRKTTHLLPTWQDIEVLESISKALSPIAELRDFLSGENHITISAVLPVLHNLKAKIFSPAGDDAQLTRDIKITVIRELHSRYTDHKVQKLLNTATFLDPRFKTQYCNNKEETKKSLENRLKNL